jgi:LPS export ABC transporter protein LptC
MKLQMKPIQNLIMVVALGTAACDGPTETTVASNDLQGVEADIVVFGMTSFLSAAGVREGRVVADTAYIFNDSTVQKLRGMEVVFYGEDGRERATVRARAGELDPSTDRMVARGNVVLIVHEDRRRLETAELHYDPARDRLWSDSATVQTLADGSVSRGSSFQSDLSFQNVRIENPRGAVGDVIF